MARFILESDSLEMAGALSSNIKAFHSAVLMDQQLSAQRPKNNPIKKTAT